MAEWPGIAGRAYVPWAVELSGDGRFPHNAGGADVTISGDTTWDETDYPGRVAILGTLTIDATFTLTLKGGPWWIIAKEIVFGDTASQISGDGPTPTDGTTLHDADYARGAEVDDTGAQASGGDGGVMVFICAGEVSGAAGIMSADGGGGFRNATQAGTQQSAAGQGAFSHRFNSAGSNVHEVWTGEVSSTAFAPPSPLANLLGAGGAATTSTGVGGEGGGTGSGSGGNAGGGSGIGGGGGGDEAANNATLDGQLPLIDEPSIANLITLARTGCLGGGGGGAGVNPALNDNFGGGGGGGSVCLWVRVLSATPTLQANGGAAGEEGASGFAGDGGAGVTNLIQVP